MRQVIALLLAVAVVIGIVGLLRQAGDGNQAPTRNLESPDDNVSLMDEVPRPAKSTDSPASRASTIERVLVEPDRQPVATDGTDGEKPPRMVFGEIPVKRSIELPVVDPDELDYDTTIGRLDVDDPRRSNMTAAAGSTMFTPTNQVLSTDDGPLAGAAVQPDPAAPGPIEAASLVREVKDTNGPIVADPLGPGDPVDPDVAASAPPNFVLPGDDVVVEDPDLSLPRREPIASD